jgi:hypothetical protein
MATALKPCIRYRAWLANTGRIPAPEFPANPYEEAYRREGLALYPKWVHRMWCNYNRKPMPEPGFSGFSDPDFDAWLQRIYLPQEATA